MTIEKCCIDDCVEAEYDLLSNCMNTPAESNSITSGVVSDIPILLTTQMVEFYLSSLIRLPEKVSSINSIDNKVIITDCRLLHDTNVLFIKGFIRKNIYYSSENISIGEKKSGDLRHCLAYVPFECTTNVNLNDSKVYRNNNELVFGNNGDKLLRTEPSHFHKISEEHFNKKVFCELVKSIIVEQCKYIYEKKYFIPSKTMNISEITELDNNMSIRLKIEILQNKEVYINPCCINKYPLPSSGYEVNLSTENNITGETKQYDKPIYIDKNNLLDRPDDSSSTGSNLTSHEFLFIALQILVINSLNPDYIYEIFEDASQ